jgi:hypothetical protein
VKVPSERDVIQISAWVIDEVVPATRSSPVCCLSCQPAERIIEGSIVNRPSKHDDILAMKLQPGSPATGYHRFQEGTMAYVLIAALIAGLLMYLLCSGAKAVRIGEMLLFSSILALLIALAPLTVARLHGG